MPATAKWLNKQPLHKSDWTNAQRAITKDIKHFDVTPTQRRFHLTDLERKKYQVVARPASSYRAAKRNAARKARNRRH